MGLGEGGGSFSSEKFLPLPQNITFSLFHHPYLGFAGRATAEVAEPCRDDIDLDAGPEQAGVVQEEGLAVLFCGVEASNVAAVAKEREAERLQAQIDQQKVYNTSVEDLLAAENDDAYVADIARDMLGYVMPGDQVFVDISSK
jgi:hypothetical protein